MKQFIGFIFCLSLLGILSCKDKGVNVGDVDCTTVTYSGTIAGLIQNNCSNPSCHGVGSSNGDYTTHATLLPNIQNGLVEERVIQDQNMPVGGPLTSEELGQLQCWIDDGAPNN